MKTEHEISISIVRKKLKRTTNDNEKLKLRNDLNKLKILIKQERLVS